MTRQTLRSIMTRPGILLAAGAHDALSAKLAEESGFDCVWASGFGLSAAAAVPDASILTPTELLYGATTMVEATSIPVLADCDSGFGDVNNVRRAVQKYESAGISGICIEDQRFPKLNSFSAEGHTMVSTGEFSAKIHAAKDAQVDSDFFVIARTEALINGLGVTEALQRAKAYVAAGADAVLIHSKARTPTEILEFASRWDGSAPLVVVPTTYSDLHVEQLSGTHVKLVIYANQALRGAISAMRRVLDRLIRDGTSSRIERDIVSVEDVFTIQGMHTLEGEHTHKNGSRDSRKRASRIVTQDELR
ncbi:MAG: isocitrate lyase/phosphoenolpyruvate mutase family protein [Chloroflexota bacterium]|nr:isocitrate lyase/phosphoenolpyruvate mutase family protein [Chloroflexota bacterium]